MNTLRTSILGLAALLAAPLAQAEDPFYLGGAFGSRSSITLYTGGAGQKAGNEPRAFNLHGGYEVNEHLAVEAGYIRWGRYRFGGGERINLGAAYLAAKGSIALGDKFSLFGKAGIADHALKLTGSTQDDGTYGKVRAMFGAGAAFRVTEQVSLTAEVVDYGTLRTGAGELKLRQVEAGLNFRF